MFATACFARARCHVRVQLEFSKLGVVLVVLVLGCLGVFRLIFPSKQSYIWVRNIQAMARLIENIIIILKCLIDMYTPIDHKPCV